jgi:pumilio family protein 6
MILRELMTEVHDVALNEFGRKVVLYLVAPRETKFTHPDVIKILSQGDSNPNR